MHKKITQWLLSSMMLLGLISSAIAQTPSATFTKPVNPVSEQAQKPNISANMLSNSILQEGLFSVKNEDIEKTLPQSASQWIAWIKQKHPELNCAQNVQDKNCVFISTLDINEKSDNYHITLKGYSFLNGYMNLPIFSNELNNQTIWPQKVMINQKPAILIEKNGSIAIEIENGSFDINISLSKVNSQNLATITMPVIPVIFNNSVKSKTFIKEGNIIKITQPGKQEINTPVSANINQPQVLVFRKLQSNIPNILSTKIKILYSGAPKEFYLGKVLPDEFEFVQAFSSLSIEKKENGFWLKLLAGDHEVNIESYLLKDINKIQTKDLISLVGNEIWSIEQISNVRQIDTLASQQLDPKQALVPNEWRHLPAFYVKDQIEIKTSRRGINESKSLKVNINRKSWFGFEKNKMTHLDELHIENEGTQFFSQKSLLFKPEDFKINGENQVIVKEKDQVGVLVPQGSFQAQSQSSSQGLTVPAQFWEGTNKIQRWEINLAPRMRLLGVSGPVKTTGTWIDSWNLYKVFSVFIVCLVFYKLFGWRMAAMAFSGLIIFQAAEVFSWGLWLSLLFVLGLLRVLPSDSTSNLAKLIKLIGFVCFAYFAFKASLFILQEAHYIVNPSLEAYHTFSNRINFERSMSSSVVEVLGFVCYIVAIIFGIMSIIKLFKSIKDSKKTPISQFFVMFICSIFLFSVPSFLSVSKEAVFGAGSSNVMPGQAIVAAPMVAPEMAQANSAIDAVVEDKEQSENNLKRKQIEEMQRGLSVSSISAKQVQSQNIVKRENIIGKKVQVGSGIPSWNSIGSYYDKYVIYSNENIEENETIKLWIVPVWLVNIGSIVQIMMLLSTLFIFAVSLLYMYKYEFWINKIPLSIKNLSLYKILFQSKMNKETV